MTLSWRFAPRFPFEPHETEKLILRSSDKHLKQWLIRCSFSRAPLAFPGNPFSIEDLIYLLVLELNRHRETSRATQHGICRNKELPLWIDPNEQRYVKAVRVLPNLV